MAVEHYHVMDKKDLGDGKSMGGMIFPSLETAAYEFCLQVRKSTPGEIAAQVRKIPSRYKVFRDRSTRRGPWKYLAICNRNACDLSMMVQTVEGE